MKRKNKPICYLLSFVLLIGNFLCGCLFLSASGAENIEENRHNSMNQFSALVAYFNEVKNEDEIYPEYFASAFIDDTGKLNVTLVKGFEEYEKVIREKIGNDFTIHYYDISYNNLFKLKKDITHKYGELRDNIKKDENYGAGYEDVSIIVNSFKCVYIDDKNTGLVVGLSNLDENKINIFKKYFVDSKYVNFENTGEAIEQKAFKAGSIAWSTIASNWGSWSIGFRCKRLNENGQYEDGFVTAAHNITDGTYGSSSVYELRSTAYNIGDVRRFKYEDYSNIDAAFIKLTNGNTMTNTAHDPSSNTTYTIKDAFIVSNSFAYGGSVLMS